MMPRRAYRPLRSQRHGCAFWIGVVLLIIAALALFSLLNAWIFMLLWGAIVPNFGGKTIGYGTAYLICLALSFVGSFFRGMKSRS